MNLRLYCCGRPAVVLSGQHAPSPSARHLVQQIEELCTRGTDTRRNMASQTEGIVTVITVGGGDSVRRQRRTVSTSTRDISKAG